MYFFVHCSIIYSSQDLEAAQIPSVDKWIKQLQYIYTIEYYFTIKKKKTKKKILSFATAQMGLESMILSEISRSETDEYHMTSLICGI